MSDRIGKDELLHMIAKDDLTYGKIAHNDGSHLHPISEFMRTTKGNSAVVAIGVDRGGVGCDNGSCLRLLARALAVMFYEVRLWWILRAS